MGHLKTDLIINSPGPGFTEPEVVMQKNYVLVTWRQLVANGGQSSDSNQHTHNPSTVWAKVYSWEGEWIEQDLGYFYGVGLSTAGSSDNNGLTWRKLLDEAGGPVATIDIKGVPMETTNASLSSDRNVGFNRNDPNIALKTVVHGKDGFYEDFETSGKIWTTLDKGHDSRWTTEAGHLRLVSPTAGNGDNFDVNLVDFSKEYGGRVGVEMDVTFINTNSGNNLGIALGGDSWDGSNDGTELSVLTAFDNRDWKLYSNGGWIQANNYALRPSKKYRFKIIADVNNQKADFYIDGKLLKYDVPFKLPSSGIAKLGLINYGTAGSVEYWIDNITVYTDPVQALVLLDADEDVVQEQSEDGAEKVQVSETLKNPLGRPYIKTKPIRVIGHFGFRPDFITGLSSSGFMSGEVATVNSQDEGYPYIRIVFESAPSGRVVEQSKPGADYKIGSSHTVTTEYTNNSLLYVGSYPEYSYYVKKVKNEDGNVVIFVTDKNGKLIKKEQGKVMVQGTYEHYESVSTYEYDIYENLVQYNSPKYNSGVQENIPDVLNLNQAGTTGNYTAGKSITLLAGFSSGSTFSEQRLTVMPGMLTG